MSKEMTTDECMEVFKKYDMELYNYYKNNMWYFGCDARRYAEYLKSRRKDRRRSVFHGFLRTVNTASRI